MAKKPKSDYDYAAAYMAKMFGSDPYDPKSKHWASRIPENPVTEAIGLAGRILKSQNHPTIDMTMRGEAEAGYLPYSTKDRKMWSKPRRKK
jgi:hypothetical protein